MGMIVIDNIVKKFRDATVLDHISLDFEAGKVHGLIGRNGSGKTMLLKTICGFVPVTSGSISVNGKVVGRDIDIPDDLGIIIEAPGFLPQYSGYKNLKLLAMIRNRIDNERILSAIAMVGLDPRSKKPVGKYSLGMRQRLGLAQAIMEDPEILLLDEPMNGLDNSGVAEIRILLQALRESGKTIILASHSKEDVQVLCDTVVELDRGAVIASNTASAVALTTQDHCDDCLGSTGLSV